MYQKLKRILALGSRCHYFTVIRSHLCTFPASGRSGERPSHGVHRSHCGHPGAPLHLPVAVPPV